MQYPIEDFVGNPLITMSVISIAGLIFIVAVASVIFIQLISIAPVQTVPMVKKHSF